MDEFRGILEALLELKTSDSVSIYGSTQYETYVTELTFDTSTVFFVYPESDGFGMYFRDFDVWITRTYSLYGDMREDRAALTVASVILLKLDDQAQLIIRDIADEIWLDCRVPFSFDEFNIGVVGYGMFMDKENHESFSESCLSMVSKSTPAEVGIMLLNHCFAHQLLDRAFLLLRLLDTDCLEQHLQYIDIELCRNFRLFYVASCAYSCVPLLADYEELLCAVEYCTEDVDTLVQLDELSNGRISSKLLFRSTVRFFPKSPDAECQYVKFCMEDNGTETLFDDTHAQIIREIGASSNALNEVFSAYRYTGNAILKTGFLILLAVNYSFAEQHMRYFMIESLEGLLYAGFDQTLAYFINTRISHLVAYGLEGRAVFYLFRHGRAVISHEMHCLYPFLKKNEIFLPFTRESVTDPKTVDAVELTDEVRDPCPVCLDEMRICVELGCSHKLCSECLQELKHCPMCRGNIESFTVNGVLFH